MRPSTWAILERLEVPADDRTTEDFTKIKQTVMSGNRSAENWIVAGGSLHQFHSGSYFTGF
jgi:hypothetical protein